MNGLFTRMLPRRSFLKNSCYVFGGVVFFADIDLIMKKVHGLESLLRLNDKSNSFLDNIFFPFANCSSLNASNFHFYTKVMAVIDDSIIFRCGMQPDFDGTTITVPTPCTYRDIPALLLVLSHKLNTPHFSRMIDRIESEYRLRARSVRACKDLTRFPELNEQIAQKLDKVAALYNPSQVGPTASLLNDAARHPILFSETEFTFNLIEARLAAKRGEFQRFEISAAEQAYMLKLYATTKVAFCDELKQHIEKSLVGCDEQYAAPLRRHLHTVIRVDLMRNLIRNNKDLAILKHIISRIRRILNPMEPEKYKAFEQRAKGFLLVRINHLLKIALKMDFEKGIYQVMMSGIPTGVTQKLEDCVVLAVKDLKGNRRQEILEIYSLENYVSTQIDKKELAAFRYLRKQRIKPYPNEQLIALLPEPHRQKILDLQARLRLILNSDGFQEIVSRIEQRDFSMVSEKLHYMTEDEQALTLYLLLLCIGYTIYYEIIQPETKPKFIGLLIPDSETSPAVSFLRPAFNKFNAMLVPDSCLSISPTATTSRYKETSSEIKRIKRDENISCVTISAIMNEIIEKILGLQSSGTAIYRSNGEKTNHLVSSIRVGTKLLVVDLTNNDYYLVHMDICDGKFAGDTLNFANAYMNGAIDNVSTDEWRKSFSDVEASFIKTYQLESDPEQYAMTRAHLLKNKSWRQIQTLII